MLLFSGRSGEIRTRGLLNPIAPRASWERGKHAKPPQKRGKTLEKPILMFGNVKKYPKNPKKVSCEIPYRRITFRRRLPVFLFYHCAGDVSNGMFVLL